ncbi:hypothetical protein [Arthrobacter sp. UYEF13]|uniref:hypothetical protein n=1 Tax=Pseudarthrobacter sp. S6 TaxID=3418420 RepID=UPI00339460AD
MTTPFGWPALLASPLYLAGLALHAVLFVACFLTPWERLRHSAYLTIPVLRTPDTGGCHGVTSA